MDLNGVIQKSVACIQSRTDFQPEIGMILGSGLGDYAERIEKATMIPYLDIPDFPISTVTGHAGQFVLGTHLGRKVIIMQGRVHAYEGYSQAQLTLPVRIMRKLGVSKLLITNAAGGVNLNFQAGALMMISDHINYSGGNPLIGPNLDEFGTRFPDMSRVYDRNLREKLRSEAEKAGIHLDEGVYMMFNGPSYETPAEIRMARIVGADAIGMSTVPEAIVANHCGMSILGISCITNMAAGILDQPLNHAEVMETANRVKSDFIKILDIVLAKVF
jgi:purine-nucleoside phosphorylase